MNTIWRPMNTSYPENCVLQRIFLSTHPSPFPKFPLIWISVMPIISATFSALKPELRPKNSENGIRQGNERWKTRFPTKKEHGQFVRAPFLHYSACVKIYFIRPFLKSKYFLSLSKKRSYIVLPFRNGLFRNSKPFGKLCLSNFLLFTKRIYVSSDAHKFFSL